MCASSRESREGEGVRTPAGGNAVMVAGSRCGTQRCLGLIRALGAWAHGVCGRRRHFQGSVVVVGSRALPQAGGGGCKEAPEGLPCPGAPAPVVSPLRQLPPSLPGGVHCPRMLEAVGAVSRSAWRSRLPRASPELSVAACPAPPVLHSHPGMCVTGLARGCSRSHLGHGAAKTT